MQHTLDQKRKQLLSLYAITLGQIQLDSHMTAAQKCQERNKAKQFIHRCYRQYLHQLQLIN